ncbi:MAG: restriction endonuclease subunit S, partial [Moraxellaceae bacterium]
VEKARYISDATFKRLRCTEVVEGDCLISRLPDPPGRSCILPDTGERMITAVDCTIVRFDTARIIPEFFNFYSQSTEYLSAVDSETTGTTRKRISRSKLGEVKIPVPPISEQQRIVAILDEAFDGIATARANTEKNLQNARALFESHLQSAFTQRGEGYVEKALSEVCAITSTLVDPKKSQFLDLTHVGAGNIESQTGAFVDLKTAREEGLISGKFLFDESMVLYSKIRPYLMKVVRPDFHGLCSADIYPLSPLPGEITRDYLFYLLLSNGFTDYAIQGSARAGMPKVNREHLFEFRAWLPCVKKQEELVLRLDDLHVESRRLESLYQRKLAALDELKKSLLHKAFSGEL